MPGPRQDRINRGALRLLDHVQPVTEVIGGGPTLGFGDAPSQCVIAETGDDRAAGLDLDQPVAIVPDVGSAAFADQVAVAVVAEGDVVSLGLAVVVCWYWPQEATAGRAYRSGPPAGRCRLSHSPSCPAPSARTCHKLSYFQPSASEML